MLVCLVRTQKRRKKCDSSSIWDEEFCADKRVVVYFSAEEQYFFLNFLFFK